jgi:hypothetical protein
MGSGKGPVGRIKMKRKDGKEGVGTNRDGTTYKAMHIEVLTIWDNEGRKGATLCPGFAITYQGKPVPECYLNVFDSDAPKGKSSDSDDDDF